jgi:hypothetical protein
MNQDVAMSTWYGRPLTRTEILLFTWLDDERQAIALAKFVTLQDDATAEDVADAVMRALVAAKEAISGRAQVEYIGGERRDTLRRKQ